MFQKEQAFFEKAVLKKSKTSVKSQKADHRQPSRVVFTGTLQGAVFEKNSRFFIALYLHGFSNSNQGNSEVAIAGGALL